MNWFDIIERVNSENTIRSHADLDEIIRALGAIGFCGLYDYDQFDERFTKHFVKDASWVCTDTRVGLAVYMLDNEIVAVSKQDARKADEEITFLDSSDQAKVVEFIETLRVKVDVFIDETEDLTGWFCDR